MAVVGTTISTPIGVGVGIHFGSSTGSVNQSIDTYYQEVLQGNQGSLDRIVQLAGLAGGVGIAPQADSKNYAKQKLQALLAQGAITGPTGNGDYGLPGGTPNLTGKYEVTPRTGVTPSGSPTLSKPGTTASSPWWLFPAILIAGVAAFIYLRPKGTAAA